jgi:hypothetical protein
VLATIGLTIPSVLVINHLIERPIITGVEHTDLCSPHPHADATRLLSASAIDRDSFDDKYSSLYSPRLQSLPSPQSI